MTPRQFSEHSDIICWFSKHTSRGVWCKQVDGFKYIAPMELSLRMRK